MTLPDETSLQLAEQVMTDDQLAAGPAAGGPGTPLLDIWARIGLQLDTVARQLKRQNDLREQFANDIWYVASPPVPLTALPVSGTIYDAGPKGGDAWAVQSVTVGPLAAAGDLVILYRGAGTADAVQQNAKYSFASTGTAGAFVTWTPGGRGLILMPKQALVFAGTIASPLAVASADVIRMRTAQLPAYLV